MVELVNDQRQAYRRGLILGFTVAEALLLILFGLLLALGSILVKVKDREEARQRELDEANVKLAAYAYLEPEIALLRGRTTNDFFRELGILQVENDSLRLEVKQLQTQLAETEIVSDIAKAAKAEKTTPDALRKAAARGQLVDGVFGEEFDIEKVERVLEIAKKIDEAIPTEEGEKLEALSNLEGLSADLAKKEKENRDLKAQVTNATRRLEQQGLGKLACWAMDAGTPDYLFDVALLSNGIRVRKSVRAERLGDYTSLPISSSLYGRTLSPAEFRDATHDLYEYSEAQNCRFFVRVYDFTAANQKLIYKRNLSTVEGHFYKYEMTNALSWGPEAKTWNQTGAANP